MKHRSGFGILGQTLPAFLLVLSVQTIQAQEFCITAGADQKLGKQGDYNYELWNQNSKGTACMTLGSGGSFSGRWSGIENYLARRGFSYNETQTHSQIGTFTVKYNCEYNPSSAGGNSYLAIYGWTSSPLIEYYIIEDWRNWIPSKAAGSRNKGTLSVDGGTYDIVQATRTQQPSIKGTQTFEQYFSIRQSTRNSGTLQVSEHFKKWESLGMPLGKLYEVAFVVEGYQSNGSFNFKELEIKVGNGPTGVAPSIGIAHKVKIAQDPHSRDLRIDLAPSVESPVVQVYSTNGVLVDSRKDQYAIRLPDLKAGLYVVKVRSATETRTSRVVVQ